MSDAQESSNQSSTKKKRVHERDVHLFKDYLQTLWLPDFRPILGSVIIVLLIGTVVFNRLENWSLLNSLYFSVVTLSTIGYGDLAPTTDAAKLFSILYIFVGVGTLGVFISAVSRASMQRTLERKQQRTGETPTIQDEEIEADL